ncbi:hypothetical protein AB6A23_02340 [Paenibacillus tarimensis]
MQITDQPVQELAEMLECTEQEILNKFKFSVNDQWLTEEESMSFIRFLKNEMKNKKE